MIEQYLSNTNEIATVLILPKILELNKAEVKVAFGPRLVPNFFLEINIVALLFVFGID